MPYTRGEESFAALVNCEFVQRRGAETRAKNRRRACVFIVEDRLFTRNIAQSALADFEW